jgi:hypothetical protein
LRDRKMGERERGEDAAFAGDGTEVEEDMKAE